MLAAVAMTPMALLVMPAERADRAAPPVKEVTETAMVMATETAMATVMGTATATVMETAMETATAPGSRTAAPPRA